MHDMSVGGDRSIVAKLFSPEGRTATSHYFVMDWASVYIDIIIGLLVAGALPRGFLTRFGSRSSLLTIRCSQRLGTAYWPCHFNVELRVFGR